MIGAFKNSSKEWRLKVGFRLKVIKIEFINVSIFITYIKNSNTFSMNVLRFKKSFTLRNLKTSTIIWTQKLFTKLIYASITQTNYLDTCAYYNQKKINDKR